jgi:MarR family 2-MHQ and catechol resistance regulon transcriptional repressor
MLVPGPRYQALIQLLRTTEGLWNASRIFFEQWDLSPSQFNVLNLLRNRPEGLSQVELSRELIMHRSNVTGLVDRLEARELLVRKASATDRRVYCVLLTPKGRDLLKRVLPEYYRAAEEVWGTVKPDKAGQLVEELSIVGQNAERIAQSVAKK